MNDTDKVGVVILNYLNYKDTIECIDSLLNIDKYNNKEIIIVDNDSKNESWKILNELFDKKTNIHLIKSKSNVGFARGNNLGIEYARKNLKCEHVLVVNNDTLFKDEEMIEKFVNEYEVGVGVIGPKIISADGKNQNPLPKYTNNKVINRDLRRLDGKRRHIIEDSIIFRIINKIHRTIVVKCMKNDDVDLMLHGCCMFLTKSYFDYYPYLFPRTFLYYEEDILTLLTKKVGLRKKYVDNTYIYHKEHQSSELSFKNQKSISNKFMYESAVECSKLVDLDYCDIINNNFR